MHEKYRKIGSPTMRVIEEAAEVLKAAIKGERFGWYNYHPHDSNKPPNILKLCDELADLQKAVTDLKESLETNVALMNK